MPFNFIERLPQFERLEPNMQHRLSRVLLTLTPDYTIPAQPHETLAEVAEVAVDDYRRCARIVRQAYTVLKNKGEARAYTASAKGAIAATVRLLTSDSAGRVLDWEDVEPEAMRVLRKQCRDLHAQLHAARATITQQRGLLARLDVERDALLAAVRTAQHSSPERTHAEPYVHAPDHAGQDEQELSAAFAQEHGLPVVTVVGRNMEGSHAVCYTTRFRKSFVRLTPPQQRGVRQKLERCAGQGTAVALTTKLKQPLDTSATNKLLALDLQTLNAVFMDHRGTRWFLALGPQDEFSPNRR